MSDRIKFDDEPIVDINITPLVDIVFVLLIIFMVTAQFIVGRGIDLELPNAKSSEILKKNSISITILKNASYVLDGTSLSLNELQKQIDTKFKNKKLVSVTISADKAVSYNSLVQLMDTLRLIGIVNFALQMDTSPSKSTP